MHSNHIGQDNLSGLLLINKPTGITSFDCIRQLRRTTGVKKIGHAGTLDPEASGLMLMLFGTACKQADRFSKLGKSYTAEITLGATSTTGDREGVISPTGNVERPTLDEVRSALDAFVGEITQTPSIYSAIKINGQEAYKLARKGEKPDMPSRIVTIHKIQVTSYKYPKLIIEADVSSGTYIRSLAADLGAKLTSGAYLSNLIRTKVGEYDLTDAVDLEKAATSDLQRID